MQKPDSTCRQQRKANPRPADIKYMKLYRFWLSTLFVELWYLVVILQVCTHRHLLLRVCDLWPSLARCDAWHTGRCAICLQVVSEWVSFLVSVHAVCPEWAASVVIAESSSRKFASCSVGEFAWCCPVALHCRPTLSASWTSVSVVLLDKAMVSLKPAVLELFRKVCSSCYSLQLMGRLSLRVY